MIKNSGGPVWHTVTSITVTPTWPKVKVWLEENCSGEWFEGEKEGWAQQKFNQHPKEGVVSFKEESDAVGFSMAFDYREPLIYYLSPQWTSATFSTMGSIIYDAGKVKK